MSFCKPKQLTLRGGLLLWICVPIGHIHCTHSRFQAHLLTSFWAYSSVNMGEWIESWGRLTCRGQVHTLSLWHLTVSLPLNQSAYKSICLFAQPVSGPRKVFSTFEGPNGLKWKLFLFPISLFSQLWGSLNVNPVASKSYTMPPPVPPPPPWHSLLGRPLPLYTPALLGREQDSRLPDDIAPETMREDNHLVPPGRTVSRRPELRWGIWVSHPSCCSGQGGVVSVQVCISLGGWHRYGNPSGPGLCSALVLTLPSWVPSWLFQGILEKKIPHHQMQIYLFKNKQKIP